MKNNIFHKNLRIRSITLRKIIIFFIFHFFVSCLSAQQIGTWQIYPAFTVCTKNIPAGKRIYGLMESKLMAYNMEDESVSTFDWHNQLNDISIQYIDYSEKAKKVVLVYDNGNIDLLSTEDDQVINLAQLKNSTLQNKQVRYVHVTGNMAYVCTGFGLLCIDVKQGIITNNFNLELVVNDCVATDDALYIGTNDGIWEGKLATNLQERSNWKRIESYLCPTRLEYFDKRLWALVRNELYISDENFENFTKNMTFNSTYMNVSDNFFIIGNAATLYLYTTADSKTQYQGPFTWTDLKKQGDTFWASDGAQGLQAYQLNDDGSFQLKIYKLHPNSPLHDYSLYFFQQPEGIFVAGGNRNYSTIERPGTAMIYGTDGTWTNFDAASVNELYPKERFLDVTSILKDPADDTHYFVGTARSGIFEFKNTKCIGHIGLENSPLQSILPNSSNPQWFVVADGIQFDEDDNMWVLNPTQGREDTTIRVRLKNGTWTGIPCEEIKEASTVDKIYFDSRGWAWFNSRRMDQRGIFLLDYNGTINRTSDDKRMLRSSITNQDGTTYNPNEFYCITENADGQIWIGTNDGPFLITDPNKFRNSDFTFEQIKVSRNDGSGLADYLLSGVPILSISIDGGGRVWFGSQGSGVYLMSADCQEEIYHFTTNNSPIISNIIYDILIDQVSGCVYFATDKGICSFMSDATKPAETLEENNIVAYPNPVNPDYHGPIIIKGLMHDSEVKILSSSGRLIWSGHSNGGMITWNGCNKQGKRVASGIYHVVANDSNGEKAIVTRIVIIH